MLSVSSVHGGEALDARLGQDWFLCASISGLSGPAAALMYQLAASCFVIPPAKSLDRCSRRAFPPGVLQVLERHPKAGEQAWQLLAGCSVRPHRGPSAISMISLAMRSQKLLMIPTIQRTTLLLASSKCERLRDECLHTTGNGDCL